MAAPCGAHHQTILSHAQRRPNAKKKGANAGILRRSVAGADAELNSCASSTRFAGLGHGQIEHLIDAAHQALRLPLDLAQVLGHGCGLRVEPQPLHQAQDGIQIQGKML